MQLGNEDWGLVRGLGVVLHNRKGWGFNSVQSALDLDKVALWELKHTTIEVVENRTWGNL